MEMELDKPSESDLLQKMQHHPSSSSSAALTASEIVSSYRLHLDALRSRRSPPTLTPSEIASRASEIVSNFRLRLDALRSRRSPPPDVGQKMPAAPLKPRTARGRSAIRQPMLPIDFNKIKDPIEKDMITKCATLAIRDYNSQTHNHYQLVVIDEFIWQMVCGIRYTITFQAMNADKEYATFEACVYSKRALKPVVIDFRKVIQIRIKGTSTWYNGTLMQLEDDAPIVMDVKDHKGGVCGDIYGLIKSAQQYRMPDVGSLVIKQDEGKEAAGALPE